MAYGGRVAAVGFAVRLIYFFMVPFLMIAIGTVIPMEGVLIDVALLVGVFLGLGGLRRHAERNPIVARLIGRQLAFEAYYRERPPRWFAYYAAYPLLLPYVLANREARREFALYRRMSMIGVALLVVFGAIDYVTVWRPEIAFDEFFGAFVATLLFQSLALLMLLVPLAVTIVGYRLEGRTRAIRWLLGAAAVSAAVTTLALKGNTTVNVPAETVGRVRLRGEAVPARAEAAQTAALAGVWAELRAGTAEVDEHGLVLGATLGRARAALAEFYRDDEARAFSLHVWPPGGAAAPEGVLLQCRQPSGRAPVWLARTADGERVRDEGRVPAGLLGAPMPAKEWAD